MGVPSLASPHAASLGAIWRQARRVRFKTSLWPFKCEVMAPFHGHVASAASGPVRLLSSRPAVPSCSSGPQPAPSLQQAPSSVEACGEPQPLGGRGAWGRGARLHSPCAAREGRCRAVNRRGPVGPVPEGPGRSRAGARRQAGWPWGRAESAGWMVGCTPGRARGLRGLGLGWLGRTFGPFAAFVIPIRVRQRQGHGLGLLGDGLGRTVRGRLCLGCDREVEGARRVSTGSSGKEVVNLPRFDKNFPCALKTSTSFFDSPRINVKTLLWI